MADDEDSGFNALAWLLWPLMAVEKVRVWWHNKAHPDKPEEL